MTARRNYHQAIIAQFAILLCPSGWTTASAISIPSAQPPTTQALTIAQRLLHMPSNAQAHLLMARRPFTFLFAVGLAIGAFLLSLFYAITRITPPDLECPYEEPRTRPRPKTKSNSLAGSKRGVIESIKTSFRRRVPPTSPLKHLGFPHSLENVGEEDEEIYSEKDQQDTISMESLMRDDGSESEEDSSEVDTVGDDSTVGVHGKAIEEGGFFRKISPTSRSASESSAVDEDASLPSSTSSSTKSTKKGTFLCGVAQRRAMRRARTMFTDPSVDRFVLERRLSFPSQSTSTSTSTTASTSSLSPLSSPPMSFSSARLRPQVVTTLSAPILSREPSSYSSTSSSGSISPTTSTAPATRKRFPFFNKSSQSTTNPRSSISPSPPPPPLPISRPRRPNSWGSALPPDESGASGLSFNDVFNRY